MQGTVTAHHFATRLPTWWSSAAARRSGYPMDQSPAVAIAGIQRSARRPRVRRKLASRFSLLGHSSSVHFESYRQECSCHAPCRPVSPRPAASLGETRLRATATLQETYHLLGTCGVWSPWDVEKKQRGQAGFSGRRKTTAARADYSGERRWISLGGQKAGLWWGYDVCVEGGMLRSVTSPAQRGRSDAVAAGRRCVALTCGAPPTTAPPSPSPAARTLPEGEVAALLAAQHSSIRKSDIFSPQTGEAISCPYQSLSSRRITTSQSSLLSVGGKPTLAATPPFIRLTMEVCSRPPTRGLNQRTEYWP